MEAYHDATKQAYGYLLIDLKPTTDEALRVRTGILPDDVQLVYVQHHEGESVSMWQDVEMSKRLEITEAFLRLLAHSSKPKRKILLQGATNEQYKGLFELCLNLLRG